MQIKNSSCQNYYKRTSVYVLIRTIETEHYSFSRNKYFHLLLFRRYKDLSLIG